MSSDVVGILDEKRGLEEKWCQDQGWTFNPFAGEERHLPDSRMFANYREELRRVITCIDDINSCFLVGAYGTGKTTFVRHLLEGLPTNEFVTAFIEKPSESSKSLFTKILTDIRTEFKRDDTVGGFFSRLVTSIRELHEAGKKCVIAIDEVADAPVEILQWIRVLSDENISTVFVGYPQAPSLIREKFFPIYDRVFKTVELKGLDLDGAIEFVGRRVKVANTNADWNKPFNEDILPFDYEAVEVLVDVSAGAPRYLWRACYDAVRWCIENGKHSIDASSTRNILRTKMESIFATITRRQRDIVEILQKNRAMPSPDLAHALKMSTAAVDGVLKPLEDAEIIRKVGKRKAYEYTLTPMAERYLAKEERA